jgi:hypothetical protein
MYGVNNILFQISVLILSKQFYTVVLYIKICHAQSNVYTSFHKSFIMENTEEA